ncbi:MAG: hypothetical protein H7343_17465 [Undibacterium sp.]|nr:hypothetical protein [Opitutaceae bacterium]
MKPSLLPIRARPGYSALVATALIASVSLFSLVAQTPSDPTQAAHVAAGVIPPGNATGDAALAKQIAELQEGVVRLETTFAKHPAPTPASPGSASTGAMPAIPAMRDAAPTPPPTVAGTSALAAPASAAMPMMEIKDKMTGMMDKMMPMPAGAPKPASGTMATPSPPAGMASMAGGGGMMGMMDMGMSGGGMAAMPQSARPGFPSASHIYHIGATGFLLDYPQPISLTTEQQNGLNQPSTLSLRSTSPPESISA